MVQYGSPRQAAGRAEAIQHHAFTRPRPALGTATLCHPAPALLGLCVTNGSWAGLAPARAAPWAPVSYGPSPHDIWSLQAGAFGSPWSVDGIDDLLPPRESARTFRARVQINGCGGCLRVFFLPLLVGPMGDALLCSAATRRSLGVLALRPMASPLLSVARSSPASGPPAGISSPFFACPHPPTPSRHAARPLSTSCWDTAAADLLGVHILLWLLAASLQRRALSRQQVLSCIWEPFLNPAWPISL